VTFDEFIKSVQERGGFDTREHAERATRAVHGQRLAGGEPSDLAAHLPGELAELARYDGPAESFDTAEFYRRVAEREGPAAPLAGLASMPWRSCPRWSTRSARENSRT
jgi:uncharacterized protein (DUF2267 family)